MTIICALTDGKQTWIGSDQQTTFGAERAFYGPKWIQLGQWWIGFSGSTRARFLTEQYANHDAAISPWGIANEIRRLLREDGWQPKEEKGDSPSYEVSAIIARPGEIWMTDDGLTPYPHPVNELAANGGAGRYALGAAWPMLKYRDVGHPRYEVIIRNAIEAAIAYDIQCGGEPWVKLLDGSP